MALPRCIFLIRPAAATITRTTEKRPFFFPTYIYCIFRNIGARPFLRNRCCVIIIIVVLLWKKKKKGKRNENHEIFIT